MTYTFETVLSVSDFDSFEDAQEAIEEAAAEAKVELVDIVGEDGYAQLTVSDPEFLEFDSGNPSHAGAYFEISIEGPNEIVRTVRQVIGGEEAA